MAQQRLDIANTFATGLAAGGVASLRFDKRGVGLSGGEFLTASLSDEAADAGCALEVPRARPETTGVVAVIGHSVGATVAMRLARLARPPDAYVFLAGAARPGEQVMAWQSRRITSTLPVPWRWFRRTIERRQAADRVRLLASTGVTLRVRRQDLPARSAARRRRRQADARRLIEDAVCDCLSVESPASDVGLEGHELGVGMAMLGEQPARLGRVDAAIVEAEAFGMRATVLRIIDKHPAQHVAVGQG